MDSKPPQPNISEKWQPPSRWFSVIYWLKYIWRRIENLVFGFVFLLVLLYFLLQTALVQNWLVRKTTNFLSEELKTTVKIEHVDFEFFDNLVLENIFIADRNGDTLLFAGKLTAGLNANVFTIFANRLEFNDLSLKDAQINLSRAGGQTSFNMDFLLDYFSSTKTQTHQKKPPFPIIIKNLNLENVSFDFRDAMVGQDILVKIPDGNIKINLLDLPSKIVDIRSVQLDRFDFSFIEYSSNRPPEVKNEAGNVEKTAKAVAQTLDTLVNQSPKNEPMQFKIGNFLLENGRFSLDRNHISPEKETPPEVMDLNHLKISDLAMDFEDVKFDDQLSFTGAIRHFAAREQSGFFLQHFEANHAIVSDSLTSLQGMKLTTENENTVIGDTFEMRTVNKTYRDFNHFNNDIVMTGSFREGSKLSFKDLTFFNQRISENSFFKKNNAAVADISGWINGSVNDLKAKNLHVKFASGTEILGDIDAKNLGRSMDELTLTCKFETAKSSVARLREVIPGFSPPAYFDKLGDFNYKGEYLLIFGFNHILNGKFNTPIGYGSVDMNLDLTGGREKAQYSGILDMRNFDLGVWTGNRDFGKTSFDVIIAPNSSGLTLPTIKASVSGTVDTLVFKNYNYRKIDLNGEFVSKIFSGKLKIEDPNINFTFDGSVNLRDTLPVFDFSADIKRLDLGRLNLMKKDWVISGRVPRINMRGQDFRDIQGSMLLRNFQIVDAKTEIYRVDSMYFESFNRAGGTRYFALKSEIANGFLDGKYDLARIPKVLSELFRQNFPEFTAQLGLPVADTSFEMRDNFHFNLRIIDSKNWLNLAKTGIDTIRNAQLIGFVNAPAGQTNLQLELPVLKISGLVFEGISLNWDGLKSRGGYDLSVFKTQVGKTQFAPMRFYGDANAKRATFNLEADKFSSVLKRINLKGALSAVDSAWQVSFNPSDITLFEESWLMDEDNYIRFGKNYFATKNFSLFNGDKRIFLDSLGGKGIRVGLTNFDLNFLDNFIKVKDVTYRGKIYDFDLAVQNLFLMQGMSLYINTDTLFVKNKPFGFITGNVEMEHLEAPLSWKVILAERNGQRLRSVGGWIPLGKVAGEVPEVGLVQPREFQTDVSAELFPLNILQQFIPGISGMDGLLNGKARLGGPFNKVEMEGSAEVDGSFILDYLKTRFHIPKQEVILTSDKIAAKPGSFLLDASKTNRAKLAGGLLHDHFKKWKIDCHIISEGSDFLVMDTKKGDNTTFYGRGSGFFDARFSGTFVRTDIDIRAITGQNTILYIPLSGTEDQKEVSFIKFLNKKDSTSSDAGGGKKFQLSDLKGMNFNMDLTVTESAEVQMIFDEQAGDIIKSKGNGNISMYINRDGEFKMYGDYLVQRGEYLFTLLNFVNKPFTLAEGGTITWFGDPYGAQLDLTANYDMNTAIYNLLQSDLEGRSATGGNQDPLIRDAKKASRVNVVMRLRGDLFKPDITFDLNFPNLTGELKTFADNRLRSLRQDPNELNRQVFGLIVVGSFLPSNSTGLLAGNSNALVNTATQWLTNQLSNYLSTLAAEWFGSAVSSINFDVVYSEYENSLTTGTGNINQTGREVQVRLSSGIINDRITVNVGSQFGLNNNQPGAVKSDGFLGEDVTFEFQLTENRKWRLKVYQRTEPDITGGNLRNRVGIGVAFRKEYDSFDEMLGGLGGWFRKKM